ncbi:helix-turn-helix transcriptional regulator [Nonomuraea sp. NPDC001831]|uniref:helix-turn-helix transcriptional regulator n=1 Tax=Nonomuraea sp. NPDC001831 TaxID=3364340 RepID=UPI003674524C
MGPSAASRLARPPRAPNLFPITHTRKERAAMATVTRLPAMLTVPEICAELQISRSTFYDWRQKGRAPRCIKLPNGDLRIRRTDLDTWLNAREDAA